jgi:hypothetical protein
MAGLVTRLPFKIHTVTMATQDKATQGNATQRNARQRKATQDKAHNPVNRIELVVEMHVDGKHGPMRVDCDLDEEAMGELHILTNSQATGGLTSRSLTTPYTTQH